MFSARMQFKTILHSLVVIPLLSTVVAVMTHGTVDAQTVNWVELGQPSARCCMGMAYDGATHSTVLFGGSGITGDTWIWSGGWYRLSPAISPPARSGAGMAYDGAAGNVVLFGGYSSTGTILNDTWTWDGSIWTQQFPPVSPPARNQMALAYDGATKTVVLFGGCNAASGACVLNDTWTWNGVAKTWTQHHPVSSPSPRRAPMAFDDANQTMLLFGGDNQVGVQYTDSWNWDGANWVQLFPASTPTARTSPNMTFDSTLGVIVLFGGYAEIWEDSLNDTWTWNGRSWTQIYPATVPPNRYNFGMVYDPILKAVLMFGGFSSTVVRGDTWLLALAP
jgi:hypothetical protein